MLETAPTNAGDSVMPFTEQVMLELRFGNRVQDMRLLQTVVDEIGR